MSEEVVKLDVGGIIFKTSKETLMKHDGTFRAMFEQEEKLKKDENSCVFIDRDPKHFRVILNFMRDGDVALPESPEDVKEIQKEAEFYKLEFLVEKCAEKVPEAGRSPKFRTIDSDEQLINLITNPVKPILIIYYRMENWATATKYFDVTRFQDRLKDQFDVYFKLSHGSGYWSYSIHDHFPTIYSQPKSCQENNFGWSLMNSVDKFLEMKNNNFGHF
ncbi:hypothetical protein B9Z55_007912 [Caenorhabditis nigoni]|nr:hypothetical protein B9Z55_007912 [Caenorhabditis nigoni]